MDDDDHGSGDIKWITPFVATEGKGHISPFFPNCAVKSCVPFVCIYSFITFIQLLKSSTQSDYIYTSNSTCPFLCYCLNHNQLRKINNPSNMINIKIVIA